MVEEKDRYWAPTDHFHWIKTTSVYVERWGTVDYYTNIYGDCRYIYIGNKKYELIGYNASGKIIPKEDEIIINSNAYKLVEILTPVNYLVEGVGYMTQKEWKSYSSTISNRISNQLQNIDDERLARSIKQLVGQLVNVQAFNGGYVHERVT